MTSGGLHGHPAPGPSLLPDLSPSCVSIRSSGGPSHAAPRTPAPNLTKPHLDTKAVTQMGARHCPHLRSSRPPRPWLCPHPRGSASGLSLWSKGGSPDPCDRRHLNVGTCRCVSVIPGPHLCFLNTRCTCCLGSDTAETSLLCKVVLEFGVEPLSDLTSHSV